MSDGVRVWLHVEDEDEWALAKVVGRSDGQVELEREHAPNGVSRQCIMSDMEFASCAEAIGDFVTPVDDLVQCVRPHLRALHAALCAGIAHCPWK